MDLFAAAVVGNTELLKVLIDDGASVNSKHETQETPLMLALENVNEDCVKYEAGGNGADVNDITGSRKSTEKGNLFYSPPLIDSRTDVNGRYIECVKLLLKHGADVNQTGMHNESPLMAAVTSGNKQCISLLLQKGAVVNQKDDDGSTALFFAKDIELVKILVSSGADVNHKNYLGKTALFNADSVNIVKSLVAVGTNVNEKDNWGQTALFDASNENVVQALIEAGASVNVTNNHCETALFRSYNRKIVKCLVEAGTNVNRMNDQGETALFRVGNEEIVKDLLALGADVNSKNHQGQTVLFFVNNVKIAKTFVAKGADVNASDKNGKTALFEALLKGRIKVVKALLVAGADVNHRDNDGDTALIYLMKGMLYSWDILEKNLLLKCVKMLLRAGLKINMPENKMTRDVNMSDEITDLLFAAGEENYGNLPDYLPPRCEIILKHLCRKVIRKHLLEVDPHTHMFGRVPRLGLPKPLQFYLMYNHTLDDDVRGDDDDRDDDTSDCDNDIGRSKKAEH